MHKPVYVETFVSVNLDSIYHNTVQITSWFRAFGIEVYGVVKACLGDPRIAKVMVAGGCTGIGDSRWQNLRRLRAGGISVPLMLVRSPSMSEVQHVVEYADLSLNSEPSVLKALSDAAVSAKRRHGVILMVEAGDLREGKGPSEAAELAFMADRLPGLQVLGIGTNVGCFAAPGPQRRMVAALKEALELVEERLGRAVSVVSGGNSGLLGRAEYCQMLPRLNQVRVGEAILLGKDPVTNAAWDFLHQDTFTLETEIIEAGVKTDTTEEGIKGEGACDRRLSHSYFQALAAVGTQDLGRGTLQSLAPNCRVAGATSDHLLIRLDGSGGAADTRGLAAYTTGGLSLPKSSRMQQEAPVQPQEFAPFHRLKDLPVKVGDRIRFRPDYDALVALMTSPFVSKVYHSPSGMF